MNDMSVSQGGLRQSVIVGLSLVVVASLATGCRGASEPGANATATAEAPKAPSSTPAPITTVAPVGRAELLAAAAAAADEVAGGNPLPEANMQLADRIFELRLPFGCDGDRSNAWGQWSLDPKTRVLRISVRPEVWNDDQSIKTLAAGVNFDAAQGFWIERPWTRSETCPAPVQPVAGQPPLANAEASPIRTLALVQLFSPDSPRTLRRGSRPYSYTGKLPEPAAAGGFRLKLTGRIRSFADGQPIHCVVLATSRPPTCAASVEFTKVALEDAGTGAQLAEWNS